MTPVVTMLCALTSQPLPSHSVQAAVPLPSQTVAARVTGIRVRGNHTTPDGDVIALSGAHVGDVFTADTVAAVQQRLEKSGRFQSVDVFRRFESLSDPSAIVLVIAVEERAGISLDNPEPGPLRRFRANTMWLP